jgi:hypothetical protein
MPVCQNDGPPQQKEQQMKTTGLRISVVVLLAAHVFGASTVDLDAAEPEIESPLRATEEKPAAPAQLFSRETVGEHVTDGGLSRGIAWGDYDNDGDPDLVVANSVNQLQMLYRNDSDGDFFQVQQDPIVQSGGDSEGVFWADYDNDGDLDLLLTNQFDAPLRLFRNDGPARAEEEGSAGFSQVAAGDLGDDRLGSANGACWGDFDNDGNLDVFVVHRDGLNNELYRNLGDGSFRRETDGPAVSSGGDARTCAVGDVDGDRDLDLYVGNFIDDGTKATNFFYLNNGDGTFEAVTDSPLVDDRQATYGASFADADEDGDLDLFLSNIARSDHNALYLNDGRGGFSRVSDGPLVTAASRPSKGHTWGDYDNDGDLDLFIANGTEADVDLRNFLYLNDGNGRFSGVAEGVVVSDVMISAGTAWADIDRDGDLDLFVANWGGSDEDNALYRNRTEGRHWLVVKLVGQRSNRMGLGARVRVRAKIHGRERWLTRWMLPATGYASQNEPIVHFGLGDAPAIQSVEVLWPSGVIDRISSPALNQVIEVVEGQRADSRPRFVFGRQAPLCAQPRLRLGPIQSFVRVDETSANLAPERTSALTIAGTVTTNCCGGS